MLADVATAHPSVRERFEEAGDSIGVDLWQISQNGPDTVLASTTVTQPALLTASFALWEVWLAQGGKQPAAMAGHSLGEYSALVCAGAMAFIDGVRLVNLRGELMQKAVPRGEGSMAAILGLDDDQIAACCAAVDGVAAPANFNAPGQTVIAGATAAVAQAVEACSEAGAKRVVMLDVSGPFHCELMLPARDEFAAALNAVSLQMSKIPIVQNVDASIAGDLDGLRERLLAQLAQPVQWYQCIQAMATSGVDRLVECGPGKVLSGLTRRIDGSLSSGNLGTLEALNGELGDES
jgi:[acyl-carrier-protein] S-malonyltransferase|tara:strand:- start:2602 stop:3480 length:879 start_codon:yes stop_codon:yes gene_type:complete